MKLMRSKSVYAVALLALTGALVIAGCGGGGSSSSSSGSSESSAKTASASGSGEGTIGTTSIPGLGTVLVDSEGMTVYDFTVDEGTTSNCYGGCEAARPPGLPEGKPTAGE